MSKVCFVVPGFAGSELRQASDPTYKVWVHPVHLATGDINLLELASDGSSPHRANNIALVQGVGLRDYFTDLETTLASGLAGDGYTVQSFGWDWRKDFRLAGDNLAAAIRASATPSDPCSIVAHSTGGLVSRYAWFQLKQLGEEHLIRRIVTLGTPHRGCYAPVKMLFVGDPEAIELIALIKEARLAVGPAGLLIPLNMPDKIGIIQIFATFPCLYELFPLLDAKRALDDPLAPELYVLANWPEDRHFDPAWGDLGKVIIGSFLKNPDSLPPPAVLTCVAGDGFSTPNRTADKTKFGTLEALDFTPFGDGTVDLDSALLPGYPWVTYPVAHSSLTKSATVLADIVDLVLDPRGPSDPVPPPDQNPGPRQELVRDPPFPGPIPDLVVTTGGALVEASALNNLNSGNFASPGSSGGKMHHVSIEYNQRDERLGGWTENFWNDAASAVEACERAKLLAQAMIDLHGDQTGYVKIHAQAVPMGTDTSVAPDSETIPFVRTGVGAPGQPIQTGDSDYPETSLYIAVYSGKKKTKQWIKGIEDGFVVQGIAQRNNPRLVDALAKFKGAITTNGWQIRFLDPSKVKQKVVSIAQDGTITYLGDILGNGNRIRISGDTDSGYANKIWTVNVVTKDNVTTTKLIDFKPPLPFIPPGGNVFLRVQSYTKGKVDDVKIIYGSSHDIGRPTGLHGGRRKKAKKTRTGIPAVA